MAKYILVISFLFSFLLRLYFFLTGKHVGDVNLNYMMGLTFAEGKNPYLVYEYYVYTPLTVFLEYFSLYLTSFIHLPFHMVSKFWPNLADFLAAFLIYRYLVKSAIQPKIAAFWSALYILNPISIMTSAAHGQLDSVTALFTLIAVYLFSFEKRHFNLSALMLGVAIAIKPGPILLVPFFVGFAKNKIREKLRYFILTCLPLGLTLTPFLLQEPLKVIDRLTSYSGVYDIGLGAIVRGVWYQVNASIAPPLINTLIHTGKLIFMLAYLGIVLLFAGSKKISQAIVLVYLLFLTTYFGVSVQYLTWLIPFAIFNKDKRVIFYIFLGSLAQLGFYLFLAQDILLGNLSTDAPLQVKNSYLYFYGNLFFWLFCLYWLVKSLKSELRVRFAGLPLWRKAGIVLSGILLVVLLAFLGGTLTKISGQFLNSI